MVMALQRWAYEANSDLGPVWSAVAAGFAVVMWSPLSGTWGEVYLTPAGEAYLNSVEAS